MPNLVVIHIAGPLAGSQQEFDETHQVIKVGRAEKADIHYPEWLTGVSTEHAELVRDVGRYELRVNTVAPVYVNGSRAGGRQARARDDRELEEGDEVRLGTTDGPGFRISYRRVDAAPATDLYSTDQEDWESMRATSKRLAWLAIFSVIVAGFGMLGYEWLTRDQEKIKIEVKEKVSALDVEMTERLKSTDFTDVLNTARESVGIVVIRREGVGEWALGTAWVYDDKRLATNAHVAEEFIRMERSNGAKSRTRKYSMFVRLPGAKKRQYRVADVMIHPGYDLMRQVWNEYDPVELNHMGEQSRIEFLQGYDVALLEVEFEDHPSLPPSLPVAERHELLGLANGEPIAFVGYPRENLAQVNLVQPNPVSQVGNIISWTNITRTSDELKDGHIILHSLPATGGASGSPIMNADGDVIALLNGGNINMVYSPDGEQIRIPSAAVVNFAQRVDLLKELSSGQVMDEVAIRRGLEEGLSHYERYSSLNAHRVLVYDWEARYGGGKKATLVLDENMAFSSEKLNGEVSEITFDFNGLPGQYLVIAGSNQDRILDMQIVRQTEVATETIINQGEGLDSHPLAMFAINEPSRVILSLYDPRFMKELRAWEYPFSTVQIRVFYIGK